MLLLLPPSETKQAGGYLGQLDLDQLGFPELTRERKIALAAVRALSRSVSESNRALGLGPTQRHEIERNREIAQAPTMPAVERYTGVLYDALDAGTLSTSAREFVSHHVAIQSALFGLLRPDDPIPAYRLSHNSRLRGLSLRALWREPIHETMCGYPGLVLDLRSESYVALGTAPPAAVSVRVVSSAPNGQRVALTHFNKKGKGELVRAIATAGQDHGSVESLLAWAVDNEISLTQGAPDVLLLDVGSPARTSIA